MNSGLCIGGPLDGKMLAHDDILYEMHKLPELGSIYSEPPPDFPDDLKDERVTYRFNSSSYHTPETSRQINFWLTEGMTTIDAFDALMKRYQKPRRHLDLLKRASGIIYRLLRKACFAEPEFREARDVMEAIRETTDESQD